MKDKLLTVLRDVNSPPGGWRYTVPETGVTITGAFFAILKPRVIQHLVANGITVDAERELLIADGACRETRPPGSWCREIPPKPIAGMPIPILDAVEQFLKCIWSALVSREFVDRTEAERRIAICMECPLRGTSPSGCSGCFSMLKKANNLLSKKGAITIPPDADGTVRDTCLACMCLLPLKVRMSNAALDKCEGGKKPPYAKGCWRLEE